MVTVAPPGARPAVAAWTFIPLNTRSFIGYGRRASNGNRRRTGRSQADRYAQKKFFHSELMRVLNGGNEIELYQYPTLGDVIFSQSRYSDIRERTGRDGSHMLLIVTETSYTNQNEDLLCILRSVGIRR